MGSHADWVAVTTGKMANGSPGAHRLIAFLIKCPSLSKLLQVNSDFGSACQTFVSCSRENCWLCSSAIVNTGSGYDWAKRVLSDLYDSLSSVLTENHQRISSLLLFLRELEPRCP